MRFPSHIANAVVPPSFLLHWRQVLPGAPAVTGGRQLFGADARLGFGGAADVSWAGAPRKYNTWCIVDRHFCDVLQSAKYKRLHQPVAFRVLHRSNQDRSFVPCPVRGADRRALARLAAAQKRKSSTSIHPLLQRKDIKGLEALGIANSGVLPQPIPLAP